jgi:hypothetical protein
MARKVILSEAQFRGLLKEENLTKSEVEKIVHSMTKSDREFETRVKNIAADVVRALFKVLWQKNGIYDADIRR